MDSSYKFKKINIKNRTCYIFDDKMIKLRYIKSHT